MDARIYNGSLLAGLAMVGGGVAVFSVPASLIATGLLLIGLTLFGARIAR